MEAFWRDRRPHRDARRNKRAALSTAPVRAGWLEIVCSLLYLEEDKDFGRIS
jgi:hypothetical protein